MDLKKYVPLHNIRPSQTRVSYVVVGQKIEKIRDNIHFDHGRSGYGFRQALPAIKTPFGYFLTDGHHDAIAHIKLGAKSVAIRILDEWLGTSLDDYWKWAEKNGYAYLLDKNGNRSIPSSDFLSLEDDPLRYFASIMARKFTEPYKMSASSGQEYPLWVKIGKSMPFKELKIADCLYRHGFQYTSGQDLETLKEQARAIMANDPVPGIKLLPIRERYDESELVAQWLKEARKEYKATKELLKGDRRGNN
jgi:hypothetical protein